MTSNRFRLANNEGEIIHRYLFLLQSTVEIANHFGVSSSAVSEFLRKNNITSDTRMLQVFENIKCINDRVQSNDILLELSKIYPTIKEKNIKYICEKNNRYKLKTEFDYIDDKRVVDMLLKGHTLLHIAKELGIKHNYVVRIAKKHDIPQQLIPRLKSVAGKDKLITLYKQHTTKEIGQLYGVYSSDVVRSVLLDCGVELGIPQQVKEKLLDKQWCAKNYEIHKSYTVVAELLGSVGQDTVAYYFQKLHNIPKHKLEDDFPVLNNKNDIEDAYRTESLASCAQKIGCTPWVLKKKLIEHSIDIKNDCQSSLGEKEVVQYIKSIYTGHVIENDRELIKPKEVDIYLPELKLAIEYCSIYYHSTKFKKDKNIHKEKMDLLEKKNIRLITLYENEWNDSTELVKKKLKNIIGRDYESVYARKCEIRLLEYSEFELFMVENHIQGSTKCALRVGLCYNNNIVAAIGVKQAKTCYDLVRYATSVRVVGGFSKLLKFIKTKTNKDIITFADLRWSAKNNIYTKTGFIEEYVIPPAFMWVTKTGVERREQYMKSKQKDKLEKFTEELTEEQNAENNNIYKIYDCGKIKYRLTVPSGE